MLINLAVQVVEGVNDTAENFLSAIERNESEIAPSSLYAAACIQEGIPFINGAPQNTFVPGLIDMAIKHKVCQSCRFEGGVNIVRQLHVTVLGDGGVKNFSVNFLTCQYSQLLLHAFRQTCTACARPCQSNRENSGRIKIAHSMLKSGQNGSVFCSSLHWCLSWASLMHLYRGAATH